MIDSYRIDKEIYVIPNGVDTNHFSIPTCIEKEKLQKRLGYAENKLIIFPAPRNFRSNVLAIEFMYEVMKILQTKTPKLILLITGGGPIVGKPPANVRYIGKVKNYADYLKAASVAVSPYPSGSPYGGARNKVLEYLACGLPTVSTKEGIQGVEGARPGKHFILAKSEPSDFAEKIIAVMNMPNKELEMLSTRARRLAIKYSWLNSAKQLHAIIRKND